MVKILPSNKDIYQAKGINMVYRAMIQHQLSYALRIAASEFLSNTFGWVSDVDHEIQENPTTKIINVTNPQTGQSFRVHCVCKYCWKSTVRWQYVGQENSDIKILRKHFKARCDYLVVFNRHLNQLLWVPRSSLEDAQEQEEKILDKLNGKYKSEPVKSVPYNSKTLEHYIKSVDPVTSEMAWFKQKD